MSLQVRFIAFLCLLALTVVCSYNGDDDIVYQCFDRKPTGREALIRIRWVLLKTVTSLYGGFLLAAAPGLALIRHFRITFSKHEAVLFWLLCVCVVSVAIGVLENGIRHLRGRPSRPPIDVAIFRKNLRQWLGK